METYRKSILTPELLAEVKRLHFQTRHLVTDGFAGDYRSAFRGRGIEFEEVREYAPGDDVRSIDWKVSARMNAPFVKSYREERELTVMIAVDVSPSTLTATHGELRERILARVGALLTLVAMRNNDKVGLITFSDRIESLHPPRKARNSLWRILREVLAERSSPRVSSGTSISNACSTLSDTLRRRSIVFLLSDFFDASFERALGSLSARHDVTAVVAADPADDILPNAGMVCIRDPETGATAIVDTSSKKVRDAYAAARRAQRDELQTIFRRHGVKQLMLSTNEWYLDNVRRYFHERSTEQRPRRVRRS